MSLNFGHCPISEFTSHSLRMVNNQHHAHTSDLTRCYCPYEMHLCHFMLCHATCTIFINSGKLYFVHIISIHHNFHVNTSRKNILTRFLHTHHIIYFSNNTHKMTKISDPYKTGHLLVLSWPRTIFGSICHQITMIPKNSTKPEDISPGIKTKPQPSPGLLGASPKNFQYSVPKSWD